jgi:hypothetical protein
MQNLAFGEEVILPSELFKCVKELAVRFRNYLKRGTLLTPCKLLARVEDMGWSAQRRFLGERPADELRFQRLEHNYLDTLRMAPAADDHVHASPVCAQPMIVLNPPDSYREIGRWIASDLWKQVSHSEGDLIESVKDMQHELTERWLRETTGGSRGQLFELRRGFDYILDDDLFDRPYGIFDPG